MGRPPAGGAGIAQILLNDVDDAVAEIRWAREAGLTGDSHPRRAAGLPGSAAPLPRLRADLGSLRRARTPHQPPWRRRLAGRPHAGATGGAIYLIEQGWYSHRALWHLIFSGVFERHPTLKFALTEQGGSSWIPTILDFLDFYYERFGTEGTVEGHFGGDAVKGMSLTPREYWARNCYVGASFLRRIEGPMRYDIGVDHMMYGVDYPHTESTYPYTRQALRWTLASPRQPRKCTRCWASPLPRCMGSMSTP